LDFVSVAPAAPQLGADGKYSVVPLALTFSGGYWAVDQFLYRLETLPRIATVGTITVSNAAPGQTATAAAASGSGGLQVTLAATFFTTDLSAGPGSVPGPTDASQLPAGTLPAPVASPTPAATGTAPSGGA
jgi:hypothetical protein